MPLEKFLTPKESDQTQHHTDSCGTKTVSPTEGFPQPSAQQGCGKGTDVDPHIEDGEAGVAARVVFAVQLTDNGGNVGLKITDAHHD